MHTYYTVHAHTMYYAYIHTYTLYNTMHMLHYIVLNTHSHYMLYTHTYTHCMILYIRMHYLILGMHTIYYAYIDTIQYYPYSVPYNPIHTYTLQNAVNILYCVMLHIHTHAICNAHIYAYYVILYIYICSMKFYSFIILYGTQMCIHTHHIRLFIYTIHEHVHVLCIQSNPIHTHTHTHHITLYTLYVIY